VSRSLSALSFLLLVVGEAWTVWHYYFDPHKKSWAHKFLEKIFLSLAHQWQTMGLLILAFAIATIVPIYENARLKLQILDQICAGAKAELRSALCEQTSRKTNLLDLIEGNYVDVFQIGLWLLTLFCLGIVSNLVIVNANTNDTRARVILVSIFMAVSLWAIGLVQDFLGR
jgi:hypothetical protein